MGNGRRNRAAAARSAAQQHFAACTKRRVCATAAGPPYAGATYHVAMWAKENKAKVIAVTNSPISALGQIGDIVLLAGSTGIGTQNSLVAPIAVANALLNGVAAANSTSALKRQSRLDRLTDRWDAFLLKLDNSDR